MKSGADLYNDPISKFEKLILSKEKHDLKTCVQLANLANN